MELIVNNLSTHSVEVFWMNFVGQEITYRWLDAGGSSDISSYEGHVWIFRHGVTGVQLPYGVYGDCVYIAGSGNSVVDIC